MTFLGGAFLSNGPEWFTCWAAFIDGHMRTRQRSEIRGTPCLNACRAAGGHFGCLEINFDFISLHCRLIRESSVVDNLSHKMLISQKRPDNFFFFECNNVL